MSVASEITRLQGVKSEIMDALSAKGVTVPQGAALADVPGLIGDIPGGGELPEGWTEIEAIKQTGDISGARFGFTSDSSWVNTNYYIEVVVNISLVAVDANIDANIIFNGNDWDGFYTGGRWSASNTLIWGGKNGREMNHTYSTLSITDEQKNGFVKFSLKNGSGVLSCANGDIKNYSVEYQARTFKNFQLGSRFINFIWKRFRVYKNDDEKIFDAIPVKNTDTGALTFYDKVNKRLASYTATTQNNIVEYGYL